MNQLKMTQLGILLKGGCTNPNHQWTSVHGYGTALPFEVCIKCTKVKVREGN